MNILLESEFGVEGVQDVIYMYIYIYIYWKIYIYIYIYI